MKVLEASGVDTGKAGKAGEAIKDAREADRAKREAFNKYMEDGLIDPENPDLEHSRTARKVMFFALEMAAGGGGAARQGTKAASKSASKAAGAASRVGKGCAAAGGKAPLKMLSKPGVPFRYADDLPKNVLGMVARNQRNPRYSEIVLRRGLAPHVERMALGHEAVHWWLRRGPLRNLVDHTYHNVKLWKFGEEFAAQFYGTHSLRQALHHPFKKRCNISLMDMLTEDGAIVGVGGGAFGVGYYVSEEWHE